MSIQWTIAATFLYAEIALVLLLVLPIVSPKRWQGFFRSRFLHCLSQQASLYFYVLLFILVLFLLDAIREMRKYSGSDTIENLARLSKPELEMQINMRLFRAQRNFYISGFALFLSLVIRRLMSLISTLASMQAESEAALKQATSATNAARDLMSQKGVAAENSSNEAHDKELSSLKTKITELEKTLEKTKQDKEAMKRQAEATNKEYDRLTEEYSKLERKLAVGSGGDKKGD